MKEVINESNIETTRGLIITSVITAVTELLFATRESFTKHDVIVGTRQIVGTGIEVDYAIYKRVIESVVYPLITDNGYEIGSDGNKMIFTPVKDEITEELDTIFTPSPGCEGLEDEDGEVEVATPATAPRDKKVNVPKWFCEKVLGLEALDRVHILITEQNLYISTTSQEENKKVFCEEDEWVRGEIVAETSYTVDKNGSLRLRKWILDASNSSGRLLWEDADIISKYNV